MSLLIDTDFNWNPTIWNPSMITTALWLDAADATTVTTVSSAVSQWNDKSGNGRNATQSSANARPLYNATGISNLPAAEFVSSDWLQFSYAWASAAFSVYVVMRYNTGAAELYPAIISENNGTAPGYLQIGGNGNALPTISISRTGQATSSSSLALPSATAGIVSYQATGISAGSVSVSAFRNGTSSGSTMALGSLGLGVTASTIGMSRTGLQDPFAGFMGEIVIVPASDTQPIRERMEGYLAHKWGLTANLPAGHPYKTVGPRP